MSQETFEQMVVSVAHSCWERDELNIEFLDTAKLATRLRNELEWAQVREIESLRAQLAEVTRERDGYKIRGDGHWETLRSIRQMDDVGQIRRWISDSASGYVEANEETLFRINEQLLATQAHAALMKEALANLNESARMCQAGEQDKDSVQPERTRAIEILSTPINLDALHEDRARECERLARHVVCEGPSVWRLQVEAAAHRAKKGIK